MDAVLVENFGDAPFRPGPVEPWTVAAMARAVRAVLDAVPSLPVGVNVLRNDARAALGIAAATGASFLRVNVHTGTMFTDQGALEGRADATLRDRRALGVRVAIAADVHVKHAVPPPGSRLEDAARETRERGLADVLIVSGRGTGHPTAADDVRRVKEATPGTPVWVGSGVTPDTGSELLDVADGAIVGSWTQKGGVAGGGVEPDRVRRLVEALRG
jgi:membrane complex biogenesis BtpA family protein